MLALVRRRKMQNFNIRRPGGSHDHESALAVRGIIIGAIIGVMLWIAIIVALGMAF